MNKLAEKNDVENAQNITLDTLQVLRENPIQFGGDTSLDGQILGQIRDDLNKKHDVSLKAINDINQGLGSLTEKFSTSYDGIRSEIESLGKVEQVMVQTADSVLDTKRRVEYGVHQIISEVQQLIKANSKDVNEAINERHIE